MAHAVLRPVAQPSSSLPWWSSSPALPTHTSFSASCLTSVLERKTVIRSACSHGTQSFNIRSDWTDSSNISLLVCQSTDGCCPQSPTFQSTSIFHLLRSPFSSIHHRGSLTLRGWYGCIDPTKTHADRSSLFGLPDVWCVPPTKPSVSSMHPINPAMWRYHVVRATHSTW